MVRQSQRSKDNIQTVLFGEVMVRRNYHQLNSLWYARDVSAFNSVSPYPLHIRSVYSRNSHRAVLQLHGRTV